MTEHDIEQFVQNFQNAWNALDPSALFDLFDPDWPTPMYLPEEGRSCFTSYEEIRSYWRFCRDYIASVKLTVDVSPLAASLSPELTLLFFGFHLDSALKLYEEMGFKPLGIDIRVNAIARQTAKGWKLISYFEGAMGPMGTMRRLLETQVRSA